MSGLSDREQVESDGSRSQTNVGAPSHQPSTSGHTVGNSLQTTGPHSGQADRSTVAPTRRSQGRPAKASAAAAPPGPSVTAPPKKRGRPRKVVQESKQPSTSSSAPSSIQPPSVSSSATISTQGGPSSTLNTQVASTLDLLSHQGSSDEEYTSNEEDDKPTRKKTRVGENTKSAFKQLGISAEQAGVADKTSRIFYRRLHHRSPESTEVTEARLLPMHESMLDNHPLIQSLNVWTAQDEASLQNSWGTDDDAVLEKSMKSNTSERELWSMMVDIFECLPWDLFRYGLKMGSSDRRRFTITRPNGQEIQLNSPYITKPLCDELKQIITHPIWKGDVTLLRYALQWSVHCRIKNHDAPLPPVRRLPHLKSMYAFTAFTTQGDELATLEWDLAQAPFNDQPFRNLLDMISCIIKKRHISAIESSDKHIFNLKVTDVQLVHEAMNRMLHFNQVAYLNAAAYHEAYKAQRATPSAGFPPTSTTTLRAWKKQCRIAELREDGIRQKLNDPAFSEAGRNYLLDIHFKDRHPCYLQLPIVTPSQQATLAGVSGTQPSAAVVLTTDSTVNPVDESTEDYIVDQTSSMVEQPQATQNDTGGSQVPDHVPRFDPETTTTANNHDDDKGIYIPSHDNGTSGGSSATKDTDWWPDVYPSPDVRHDAFSTAQEKHSHIDYGQHFEDFSMP